MVTNYNRTGVHWVRVFTGVSFIYKYNYLMELSLLHRCYFFKLDIMHFVVSCL